MFCNNVTDLVNDICIAILYGAEESKLVRMQYCGRLIQKGFLCICNISGQYKSEVRSEYIRERCL